MSTTVPPAPQPPQARPVRSRTPAGRILLALLGLLLVLAGLNAASWALAGTEVETSAVEEPFTRLVVDAPAGGVDVSAGAEATVRSTRRSWLGPAPRVEVEVAGGVLHVRSRCPGWRLLGSCSVRHDVVVPDGTDVEVTAGAGSVAVSDVLGGLDLRSSAGSVRVAGSRGAVRATSSAGSVTVEGASREVDASSSAGSVTVTTAEVPSRIDASSSAGSVTVTVPDGTYRVDAETSAGRTDVQVPTDPDATSLIRARSSAGSVSVLRR